MWIHHVILRQKKFVGFHGKNITIVITMIFVNAVYLFDDHFTIVFNTGSRMMEIKDIPIDDIETALSGCFDAVHSCSLNDDLVPP